MGAVCSSGPAIPCSQFASTYRHGIALGTIYTTWSVDLAKLLSNMGMNSWPSLGITPEITWQPTAAASFAAINSGTFDAYIKTSADELKAFGSTVFIRPFHEFNGTWYPWGLPNQGANSQADAAFIAAWQHIHDIFQQEGATNVKFVWCFSTGALPLGQKYSWDNPPNAYPGDAYVDWISFDTYNRGTQSSPPWRTFDQIVQPPYQMAVSISNNKPILVAEIASNEYGDGGAMKASWIGQMLTELSAGAGNPYPNIRALSWFELDIKGYTYDSGSTPPVYDTFVNGIRTYDQNGVLNFRSNGSALDNVTGP